MAFEDVLQRANNAFQSGKTKNIVFRRRQLENLLRCYEENRDEMASVLAADLRRPKQEAMILEVEFLINDIKHTLNHLDEWAAAEKVNLTWTVSLVAGDYSLFLLQQPAKGFVNVMDEVLIFKDPLGVVLVMGSWNYPLQLPLVPFGSAIAAGNVVILKPSEVSSNCAKFIAEKIPKYLDNVGGS